MRRIFGWGTMIVTALAIGAPVVGQAQEQQQQVNRQQQMEQQQQRIRQLDQMAQRMERIQQQIRNMNRILLQDMDRLRAQTQNREQNQVRIRQTERIRDMGESLGQMARQMEQTMLQLRAMEGDPNTQGDRIMLQQMTQLREHLQGMCEGMEEGFRIMEQLHERVRLGPNT